MYVQRNNEAEPLAPVTPLAELGVFAQVLVEVSPVDYVGRLAGLRVPDEGDPLAPCQGGRGAVGPPFEAIMFNSGNNSLCNGKGKDLFLF